MLEKDGEKAGYRPEMRSFGLNSAKTYTEALYAFSALRIHLSEEKSKRRFLAGSGYGGRGDDRMGAIVALRVSEGG